MTRAAAAVLLIAAIGLLARPGTARAARASSPPDSVILVLPGDGRAPQPIPRISLGDASYVPLGSLARALGFSFAWDPFTYRGWIASDSVRTRFLFDSPIFSHGGEAIQADAEVSYDAHGVLLPAGYLELLSERWHGERRVSWRPAERTFRWGADAPLIRQIRITQIGRRTTLKIATARAPRGTRLLWSPVGGIAIDLIGLGASAESLSIGPPRGLIGVRDVRGTPAGCMIRLDVSPEAVGAQSGYDAHDAAWEMDVTSSPDERDRGRFLPLQEADPPDRGALRGPVLVTCLTDPGTDPAEADSALIDLAHRVVRALTDTLAQPAEYASSRDPLADAPRANARRARCVVALRLDGYATGTGRIQICRPAPRLRWDPLEQEQTHGKAVPRPMLWSETPAVAAAASERLASMLRAHLESFLGSDRVEVGERPTRWLEGYEVPAVLVYPAQANDPLSIEHLMDPAQRTGIARAIAFGVAEGFAMAPGEGASP